MTEESRPAARPAGLHWRLFALVYDLFPLFTIWMLVSLSVYLLNGAERVSSDSLLAWVQSALQVLATGTYAVLSWRRGGQTLGMRPWRIKVVDAQGQPAPVGRLWLRFGVACLTSVIGLLWCLVDRERRGLHDLAAGTLIVRMEKAPKRKPAAAD